MQMIGQHAMHDLRQTLFSHLQRLDVQFFDKNPVGRLMTRVMGDVQVLNELFASGVITVFANLLQILGIMVAMLLYNLEARTRDVRRDSNHLRCNACLPDLFAPLRFGNNVSSLHGSMPFCKRTSSV